jgi:hypothetical protein
VLLGTGKVLGRRKSKFKEPVENRLHVANVKWEQGTMEGNEFGEEGVAKERVLDIP